MCCVGLIIVVKEPVIPSEPTIETGTTRDRPGEREFCLLLIFSSEKVPPLVRGEGSLL